MKERIARVRELTATERSDGEGLTNAEIDELVSLLGPLLDVCEAAHMYVLERERHNQFDDCGDAKRAKETLIRSVLAARMTADDGVGVE